MITELEAALAAGTLSAVDVEMARWLASFETEPAIRDSVLLVGAWLSAAASAGDSTIEFAADGPLFASDDDRFPGIERPDPSHLATALRSSVAGGSGGPLIVSDTTAALTVLHDMERRLASALAERAGATDLAIEAIPSVLELADRALFEGDGGASVDRQRLAALLALRHRLLVVSGGPGTGKTYAILRVLALRQRLAQAHNRSLHIALAAPTGKAAARVTESLRLGLARLPAEWAAGLPLSAATVHRLLGRRGDFELPEFGTHQPLPHDVVVVDEASMLDLELLDQLIGALRDDAQLILLGDHRQLASVGVGNVLADLAAAGDGRGVDRETHQWVGAIDPALADAVPMSTAPLAGRLVELTVSRRFGAVPELGQLVAAIGAGDAERALNLLDDADYPAVNRRPLRRRDYERWLDDWSARWRAEAKDEDSALELQARQYVLCAVKEGPWGVHQINARLADGVGRTTPRPVIVTVNDHAQALYNGDLGIVTPASATASCSSRTDSSSNGLIR